MMETWKLREIARGGDSSLSARGELEKGNRSEKQEGGSRKARSRRGCTNESYRRYDEVLKRCECESAIHRLRWGPIYGPWFPAAAAPIESDLYPIFSGRDKFNYKFGSMRCVPRASVPPGAEVLL